MDPFANDAQLKRWRDACCGAGTDPLPLTKNEGAAILDRLCAAEEWQLAVADGLGFANHAEGSAGYEVAEPSVIIDAFRATEAARERAEAVQVHLTEVANRATAERCDVEHALRQAEAREAALRGGADDLLKDAEWAIKHVTMSRDAQVSLGNVITRLRALASPRTTPPEAAPRRCVVRGCDCGGALHVWPATPPEPK